MEGERLPFTSHLAELRTKLIRSFIAFAVGFLISYAFVQDIFAFLMAPLIEAMPAGAPLVFTTLTEGFFTYFKLAMTSGLCLAFPVIAYQIWSFISPGLLENEKKFVLPFLISVTLCFIMGITFCYYVVFPSMFRFFVGFSSESIVPMPSIKDYLAFSSKMLLFFGLIFEYPPLVFFLSRFGLITSGWLKAQRRYAIVLIFVIAAIVTPPDVVSQILMTLPMIVLYEIGIIIASFFGKKSQE